MTERRHTVLVVDDDHDVRKVIGRWVERLGYDLEVAESTEAALGVLATAAVDVAICDIRMPGADGIWLADRSHQDFPTVPVVLATGLGEMNRYIVLRPGVVAYVVKPIHLDELTFAIRTGLAWRQSELSGPDQYFVRVDPPPSC